MRSSFYFLIAVLVLVCGATGCDFIYHLLQREGAEEKQIIGEIVPSVPNPAVERAQRLLRLYGYNPGRPDGKMGPQTRSTIAQFQEARSLKVNHFIDKATWAELTRFEDNGLVVDGEVNIRAVQEALGRAGFHPGGIDGKMGRRTIGALKAFQKSAGLKVDGKIGFNTLNELAGFVPGRGP